MVVGMLLDQKCSELDKKVVPLILPVHAKQTFFVLGFSKSSQDTCQQKKKLLEKIAITDKLRWN